MLFHRSLFFQGLRMLNEATRGGPPWVDTPILGWINKQKSYHAWLNLSKCNLIICWFSFDMLLQVTEEQLAGHDRRWLGRMEKVCCCNKVGDIMLFEFCASHWRKMHLFCGILVNQERGYTTWRYWLKRCLRQSRCTFTKCIVRHHFCSAFAFYFSELLCVIAFYHPSHCACVDWVEYCLIMMFIVTNFGNAKYTIKVWLSSGFFVTFSIHTYTKQLGHTI
jgi:hypothetical protein